ncbi:MAG: radical SAM protein [Candidatus Binatia bacterium]
MAGRSARLALALARGRQQPYSMVFVLTNRCNFRCDYCDVPANAGAEMTTDEFRGAISELAGAGMGRAAFGGGEALLRPDAVDLIAHAKAEGCFTSLNSNGWKTERFLDRLAGCLDMLVVSLDGPDDVHDVVRRRPGSYARVIRVIQEARKRGIAVATISVIGPWNEHRVAEILALAKTHGFWSYFQPAYLDCFAHDAGLHPGIDPAMLARLADQLSDAIPHAPVGSSPGFFARLRSAPRFSDCSRCTAGRYFATVMPDGLVVPCHLTMGQHAFLNGREVGFARAFREMPRPTGPGCAISPYNESDLIFSLDPRAVIAAVRRAMASLTPLPTASPAPEGGWPATQPGSLGPPA